VLIVAANWSIRIGLTGNVSSTSLLPPWAWTEHFLSMPDEIEGCSRIALGRECPFRSHFRQPPPIMAGTSRMVLGGKHAVTRGTRGEEIETWGHFCKPSVTWCNSEWTYFDLAVNPRTFLKSCQRARGCARALPCFPVLSGRRVRIWPNTIHCLFFFFFY
jgi:hypothetical protein